MERFTLRDAAARTARSVTTLRRYIRAGRLRAEKVDGRYGPEYTVSGQDLSEAGFDLDPIEHVSPRAGAGAGLMHAEPALRELVPSGMYQELLMKHEQLLVQYGMIRAGGLRMLEWKAEAEAGREEARHRQAEMEETRRRLQNETSELRKRLREAELELEGRNLEIAALQEKLRGFERVARPADPAALQRQLDALAEQKRRVERLDAARGPEPTDREWTFGRGGHGGH